MFSLDNPHGQAGQPMFSLRENAVNVKDFAVCQQRLDDRPVELASD
jgi:hypothetical protein